MKGANKLKKLAKFASDKFKYSEVSLSHEGYVRRSADKIEIEAAYGSRKYSSDIENNLKARALESRKKDAYFEKLLDKNKYSFKKPYLVVNPYKIAPLSALVLFNTKEACSVKYVISGIKGSDDYEAVIDKVSCKHRVPIVGLFENVENVVSIALIDKSGKEIDKKLIRIQTPKVSKKIAGKIEITTNKKESCKDFFFVSGGYSGGAYAFDKHGNIRWSLKEKPMHYGVYLFEDGRFIFPELHMRRPVYGNAHSVVSHEMDMMGRVSRTYYHPKGFHHWACEEKPGGNLLTVSSSLTDTYMENVILELDRDTGESLHETSLNDLFDSTYVTRNDWVHLNAMDYVPNENTVIACMRNIHSVAKINLNTNEIIWIMTNPEFFKGTEQEEKCLTPEGHIDWFFQQHGAKIIHEDIDGNPNNLHLMIFDNHTVNRRPVPWFDGEDKYSYACVYTIDEEKRTFKQEKRFQVPICATRCNNEFYYEDGRLFVMCARLVDGKETGWLSKIIEFDFETGELLNEITLQKDFFTAHCIKFNPTLMAEPLVAESPMFLGELYSPVEKKGKNLDVKDDEVIPMSEAVADEITFRMMGDVLQLKALDHDIEKIYLYNDKRTYIQDFTDSTQPLEIFKVQSYYISMPLCKVAKGEYKLVLQYKGEHIDTGHSIKVEG